MSPAPALVVRGPAVPRADEILTPEALEFVADLQRGSGPAGTAGRTAARAPRGDRPRPPAGLPPRDPGGEGGAWQVAPAPPDLVDRRVEITGPTEPKMAINALNSGAKVWLADLEDANTPHWANVVGGQVTLRDAVRRTLSFTSPEGKQYRLRENGPLAVIVCGRAAGTSSSSTCCSTAAPSSGRSRFRAARLPQRGRAAPPRQRPVRLPAQDREPPRGAALERRLHLRRGPAPDPVRQRPRDRAHRDDSRRVRDGGDPPRAARPRERAQCRALGLPLQSDQELPGRGGRLRAARPERRHDDRAADARVHRVLVRPATGGVRSRSGGWPPSSRAAATRR